MALYKTITVNKHTKYLKYFTIRRTEDRGGRTRKKKGTLILNHVSVSRRRRVHGPDRRRLGGPVREEGARAHRRRAARAAAQGERGHAGVPRDLPSRRRECKSGVGVNKFDEPGDKPWWGSGRSRCVRGRFYVGGGRPRV